MVFPLAAQAATITVCKLDKNVYNQGETGYITLTIYDDEAPKIRVIEHTSTIDYYFYSYGTAYTQTIFTNATLPIKCTPAFP